MAEAEQREQIGIVTDSLSGQRFAERLTRAGVVARAVSFEAFEHLAGAGQMYLAPLSLSASAEAVARRGAHVCLAPPWPAVTVTIGGSAIGAVEAEHRGGVRYTSALETTVAQHGARQSLKILYRERLIGALGTALAESETGEPLLATLPRQSNRHGYITVTTLQLAAASAQTTFDDVAHLLESLYAWCTRYAEPVSHAIQESQFDAGESSQTEASAHIVLLAFALAASNSMSTTSQRDTRANQLVISAQRAYADFNRICGILGLTAKSPAFDRGWAWLEAHGVLSVSGQGNAVIEMEAIARYTALWQLGPRLRRLRSVGDMAW